MNAPCMHCTERKIHCHNDCERYLEYKQAVGKANKERVIECFNTNIHINGIITNKRKVRN